MSRHRRFTRPRAGASALVAAGLLVVASACSATGGGTQDVATGPGAASTTGIAYLNQAAAATNEAETLKVSMETTVSGLGAGGAATSTSTGEVDRSERRAHVEVDVTDTITLFDPDADLPEGSGVLELVLDGDTAYLRSPLYSSFSGADEPWVSISRDDLGADRPGAGTGQGDPADLLALLEGAGGTLTELGREDVRGVPTRHVSTVIDLEKALAQLPDERHQGVRDELEGFGAEAASFVTIPAEAWVDDDGHVRRLRVDLDFSKAADEVPELAGASVSITVELFDFDAPVDIAVPDQADVAELDLGALLGGD